MSFDDALARANFSFSFVYFLQFYLLNFLTLFNGGLTPPKPLSGYATAVTHLSTNVARHSTQLSLDYNFQ